MLTSTKTKPCTFTVWKKQLQNSCKATFDYTLQNIKQQKIKELWWKVLPHPPYSPDLAPIYSEDSHNATSLNATFRIMQLTVIITNLVHQSLIATFKNYIS